MLLERGATGRDHFFSVSGGGATLIALCGFSTEEFVAWSESKDNGVGCETF
jgi:hypothetical protein